MPKKHSLRTKSKWNYFVSNSEKRPFRCSVYGEHRAWVHYCNMQCCFENSENSMKCKELIEMLLNQQTENSAQLHSDIDMLTYWTMRRKKAHVFMVWHAVRFWTHTKKSERCIKPIQTQASADVFEFHELELFECSWNKIKYIKILLEF